MDSARVGIFEDDEEWRNILTETIEENGHSVTLAAGSMKEAQAAISSLEADSLDVAIVDGNLSPNVSSGADGAEVTRLLHEKFRAVTVIGFSGSNEIEGVDISVKKTGSPTEEIPAVIAEL